MPSYWEIAQELVEGWLVESEKNAAAAQQHRQMTSTEFGERLGREIATRVQEDDPGRFDQLQAACERELFELDEDRIARTLRFLTHSGWVYWRPDLFEGRVIVGQKWALEGIYTLLQRPDEESRSGLYHELVRKRGRFTMQDLERWGWGDTIPDANERELLITFLQQIGMCFTLVVRDESLWGRDTYVSLQHLPLRANPDLDWPSPGESASVREVRNQRLHRGHCDELLRELGSRFGTDGRYLRDGFFARTKEKQRVWVDFTLDERGFDGTIAVRVEGPESERVAGDLAGEIREHVEAAIERRRPDKSVGSSSERPRDVQVFLSYAWEPKPDEKGGKRVAIPQGYEGPVNAIHAALKTLEPHGVRVLRDRDVIQPLEFIHDFIDEVTKTDRLVVVHSDKYWRSQFCMFELCAFCLSLLDRTSQDLRQSLILVSHIQSGFDDGDRVSGGPISDLYAREVVKKYWREFKDQDYHPLLKNMTNPTGPEGLRSAVANLLDNTADRLCSLEGMEIRWNDQGRDQILERIKARVLKR